MIHLGMIVRDELPMLTLTVPVYAPFFTHKWALDTGSTDGTIEYLREQGFVVVCTEWANDYSKARNTLLDLKRLAIPSAYQDWLLFLDADECMWPADLLKLDTLTKSTVADVITLPRINLAAGGKLQEVGSWPDKQARCLRLSAPLEFQRQVHEVLHYTGHSTNVVGEERDEFSEDTPIHHYGWTKTPQECWLRSHNYHLLSEGREPISMVPNDIASVTEEEFIADLSKRHKFTPFMGTHPLEGRL